MTGIPLTKKGRMWKQIGIENYCLDKVFYIVKDFGTLLKLAVNKQRHWVTLQCNGIRSGDKFGN